MELVYYYYYYYYYYGYYQVQGLTEDTCIRLINYEQGQKHKKKQILEASEMKGLRKIVGKIKVGKT